MLWRVLQAHGGVLPPGCLVIFCNTGKERNETLDFVRDCGERWGVRVLWLEYRNRPCKRTVKGVELDGWDHYVTQVDHATASRKGEPFEMVIEARSFLPNQAMRFCTGELKIRTTRRFLKLLGWTEYDNLLGIRYDEPHRRAKLISPPPPEYSQSLMFDLVEEEARRESLPGETPLCPLYDARVDVSDMMEFWGGYSFDLRLRQDEGNCDLCMLKGQGKLVRLMQERPQSADWWMAMEAKGLGREGVRMGTFIKYRPYSELLAMAQGRMSLPLFGELDFDTLPCHCTD